MASGQEEHGCAVQSESACLRWVAANALVLSQDGPPRTGDNRNPVFIRGAP